jgi:hypothetical protein
MSGGGSPPPAPDYIGTAKQQGQSNLDALRLGAVLNRVNEKNPYSSTTYTQDASNPDRWTQETTLSPTQEKLFNQNEQNQLDVGRIANLRLGQVGAQGEFTLDGLPDRVTNVQQSNFKTDVGMPSDQARQHAEDAVYSSASRYLDPQFNQREDATRTRLINQGVTEGSEAWNNDMAQLERDKEQAYGDARDRAVMAGGAEASRSLSDDLSRANFSNTAESQRYAQALQNAQLQNEGRSSALNEEVLQRDTPLREFMSLYGGGYAAPNGSTAPTNVGSPAPADIQGATAQQYGANAQQYNWQQGQNAQNVNSGLNLAAILASLYNNRK